MQPLVPLLPSLYTPSCFAIIYYALVHTANLFPCVLVLCTSIFAPITHSNRIRLCGINYKVTTVVKYTVLFEHGQNVTLSGEGEIFG